MARSHDPIVGRNGRAAPLCRSGAALRRLVHAFNSLDPTLKHWFNLTPGFPARTAIEKEIEKAELMMAQPSAPPRRDGSRNQAAAKAAYDLLKWRGHDATAARRGKWEKLSKILAGDLSVHVFDHLRKIKQDPGLTVEKVRLGNNRILYHSRRREPGIKLFRKKSAK